MSRCIAFFILLLANISFAQTKLYTTEHGLLSTHIYKILQDHEGFIWIATDKGIAKFNGLEFKLFNAQSGLPNQDVWDLYLDSKNRIWLNTKSDKITYIQNDSIHAIPNDQKIIVQPYFMEYGQDIFVSDHYQVLFSFHQKKFKKKFDYIDIHENITKKIEKLGFEKFANAINANNQNTIAYDLKQAALFDINGNIQKKIPYTIKGKINSIVKLNSIFIGVLNNRYQYHTTRYGVFLYDLVKEKATYLTASYLFEENQLSYFFKVMYINEQYQFNHRDKVVLLDYDFNIIKKYKSSSDATATFIDKQGNMWYATNDGLHFEPYHQVDKKTAFDNQVVRSINKIENHLLIGVNKNGFFKKINDNYKKIISINAEEKVLHIDAPNKRLISEFGVYNYDKFNNGSHIFYPNRYDSLYVIKDYLEYNSSILVSNSSSLHIINKNKKKIIPYIGLHKIFNFQDKIYFTSTNGLKAFYNYGITNIFEKQFAHSILSYFSEKKYVLVGTDGFGLYMFDGKEIVSIPNTENLSVNNIKKHSENIFWLATDKGIWQLKLDDNEINNSKISLKLTTKDGLINNNCNDVFEEENVLYVGTNKGLQTLDLTSPNLYQKPHVQFENNLSNLFVKKENRENIIIRFYPIDFIAPEQINYVYRIKNISDTWNAINATEINLGGLSHGKYTIELKATNHNGHSSIVHQNIEIEAYWHELIGIRIATLMVFLLLIFLVIRYFVKMKLKQNLQKQEILKKQSDLELMALRSQMNPHFVHNSLNAIQYYIQRNDIETSEEYLSKFSKLIRLFFEHSRNNVVSLEQEIDLLQQYLAIEKLRFEDKIEYRIEADKRLDLSAIEIPSMLMQPIVENAVNHGLFHKKGKGNIQITIQEIDENSYQIQIIDDGIGIENAKALYKYSVKNYQSKSSEVIVQRIEILNQTNFWKIEYQIKPTDALNLENPGTTFTINIQKRQDEKI